MKILLARISGCLERPFVLLPTPGANLTTTIRGGIGHALFRLGCLRAQAAAHGNVGCSAGDGLVCLETDRCPVAFFHGPYSRRQRRNHRSPLSLWITPAPEQPCFEASIVLWGTKAASRADLVFGAFDSMGGLGLPDARGRARFSTEVERLFEGTLGEWLASALGVAGSSEDERILLEIPEAADVGGASLSRLVGNVAHDLIQWDLEDQGESVMLGKAGCDARAETARRAAEAALEGITLEASHLTTRDQGSRRSRSNRREFALRGVRGCLVLRGDIARALPWLLPLTLRGIGGRGAFGLGAVRLWRPSGRQ